MIWVRVLTVVNAPSFCGAKSGEFGDRPGRGRTTGQSGRQPSRNSHSGDDSSSVTRPAWRVTPVFR
jgi:hypothetical protein